MTLFWQDSKPEGANPTTSLVIVIVIVIVEVVVIVIVDMVGFFVLFCFVLFCFVFVFFFAVRKTFCHRRGQLVVVAV